MTRLITYTLFVIFVVVRNASANYDLVNHTHETNDPSNHGDNATHSSHVAHDIHVATFRYEYVRSPLFVVLFILIIGAFKVVFHSKTLHFLTKRVPESCVLILTGVCLGLIFQFSTLDVHFLRFNEKTFFLYLLPPIILDSAYSLRDRAFMENLGTILLYAVIGTVLNIVIIGLSLYGLQYGNVLTTVPHNITTIDCFIYSSLISAVDPVAVLSIFEEVGVNKMLYYMVFGESLLNDAVTIVAYNLLISFSGIAHIGAREIALGFASFICVACGGAAIGFTHGFLSALFTKYSFRVKVVEPVAILGIAYLSYLVAEMVHFSGIISIICCGIIQSHYAMDNISTKSYLSIKFFAKVMSGLTESLIFVILGVMIVNSPNKYDFLLDFWSVVLCLVARLVVVFFLTTIVNHREQGIREISVHEQIIMTYGGLRGAVSFSLILMTDIAVMDEKYRFLSATFVVIFFTVFIQGITIKPLVGYLRIKLNKEKLSVFSEVHKEVNENMVFAIEKIVGHYGTHWLLNYVRHKSQYFIRPMIQRHVRKSYTGLLQKTEEAMIQSQFHDDIETHEITGEPINDRCELNDETHQSHATSEAVFDDLDERKTRRPRSPRKFKAPPKLEFKKEADFIKVQDILRNPLPKTVYFKMFDRNETGEDVDQLKKKYESNLRASRRRSSNIKARAMSEGAASPETKRTHFFLPSISVDSDTGDDNKGGTPVLPSKSPIAVSPLEAGCLSSAMLPITALIGGSEVMDRLDLPEVDEDASSEVSFKTATSKRNSVRWSRNFDLMQ